MGADSPAIITVPLGGTAAPSNRFRVALIGRGNMGFLILRGLVSEPGCQIVVPCDLDGVKKAAPKSGSPMTRRRASDSKRHLGFRPPSSPGSSHLFRGNDSVLLQVSHGVQVRNSFARESAIVDCGAILPLAPSRVTPSAPPLHWQTHGMVFQSARLSNDAASKQPARVIARHNGVRIHEDIELTQLSFEGVAHPDVFRTSLFQDCHIRVQPGKRAAGRRNQIPRSSY